MPSCGKVLEGLSPLFWGRQSWLLPLPHSEPKNAASFSFSLPDSSESVLEASRTIVADLPVVAAACLTLMMLLDTSEVPVEAS